MLERWIYISTSQLTETDAPDQVRAIVDVSVSRNASLGVTGALIFTGWRFAQYLEGPAAGIAELKRSVLLDSRHQDVCTIAEGRYDHRRFLTWSLAYAGPSRFVASKVEDALTAALNDSDDGVEALAEMMAGFAIEGNG